VFCRMAYLVTVAVAQTVMPGETTCSTGASPCEQSCDGGLFSLSGFDSGMPSTGYYDVTDTDGHHYFFISCGAIPSTGPGHLTCNQNQGVADPVAIQTYAEENPPDFPQGSCAALGSFSTQHCTSNGAHNVTCHYANGDGSRTVDFNYLCADTYTAPTASQPDPEATPPHYLVKLSGPAACAGPGGPAGGSSWGTLFLILFPVFCALYFGLGYGYNYKYRELRGVDAVPQLEYWKQLPGLVKDGCKFSYAQTQAFINYARERQRGGAPDNEGLKRALADNEEGAETAYEERPAGA